MVKRDSESQGEAHLVQREEEARVGILKQSGCLRGGAGGSARLKPESSPGTLGLRLPAQPGTAPKSLLVLVRLNPDGQGGARTAFPPRIHTPPASRFIWAPAETSVPKGLGQSKARGTALLQPEVRAQLSPPKPRTPCRSNWAEDASLSSSRKTLAWASLRTPGCLKIEKEKKRLGWGAEDNLGGGGVKEELDSRPMDRGHHQGQS